MTGASPALISGDTTSIENALEIGAARSYLPEVVKVCEIAMTSSITDVGHWPARSSNERSTGGRFG